MTIDNWFVLIMFLGVYICCLLLLDGAHRGRIAELKHIHQQQLDGLRTYIRTLTRERKWLEQELEWYKQRAAKRERQISSPPPTAPAGWSAGVSDEPEHIQWMPLELPPSEEYEEEDG